MGGKSAGKNKLFIQYGALPYAIRGDEVMVLLVTSRETMRWVIPKGWPEKDLLPHEVAVREAFEEAGLVGEIARRPLASFQYLKRITATKSKRCLVEIYPLEVRQELDDWPEKSQRRRQWMTADEAASNVVEDGLADILRSLPSVAGRLDPSIRRGLS